MSIPNAVTSSINALPPPTAAPIPDDKVEVGRNMSEPPLFPANVAMSDRVDDGDNVVYLGIRAVAEARGVAGATGSAAGPADSVAGPAGHVTDVAGGFEQMGIRPELAPAQEAPVVFSGTVDLDRLLGMVAREHSVQLLAAPPSFPLLAVPPKQTRRERERADAAALQQQTVLGKRQRDRSPSPELQLTEELFEEIGMVNGLFKEPCLGLVEAPAVFELLVAGDYAFRVNLSFSSGYPLEVPALIAVESENGEELKTLAQGILDGIKDGKPCLERLARGMAEALEEQIGEVPWKYKAHKVIPIVNSVKGRWFPTLEELDMFMENLRAAKLDYPPKMPVFEIKDGLKTALISEGYAQDKLTQEGQVIEGNERLEFLGDAVLNTLIASAMFRMYQVNEGGMTKLHDILRSNMLFSVFSRAYEFPGQLKQKQGPVKPSGFYEPAFKKEADIFEAVVGGLHLDSAAVPGGAIAIQKWFDILIEPWIDWTLTRMNSNLKSSFMTYNRIPLEPRKPSKALAHAPPGSRARAGSPRRKIAVASSSRIARRAAKKAPRHSTIGGWPGAPEGMNVDAMHAGAEERRWARIQRLEDYQTFEVQTPRGDRPAPEHTVDGQGHEQASQLGVPWRSGLLEGSHQTS